MLKEQFADFLEIDEAKLSSEWRSKAIIADADWYSEEVYRNGLMMYKLVVDYLKSRIDLQEVEKLARQVAVQYMQASINIGDFVYNVSLGRSVIFNRMYESGIPLEQLQETIVKINECFDRFLYSAVSCYAKLKDTDLEKKELFIEQTHKERLTILGQMASSFVHEFRNPLTSVIGFTKLLKQKYNDLEYLDIMEYELEQLKYRISQFLLVSRRGDTDRSKKVFLLSELFEEVLDFLYPSLVDGDVEVTSKIQPNVYFYGYKEETRQVLINLMINSIDALQQINTPRKLLMEMKIIENEIEISVSNNGPCISPSLIQAIFEPFVTTKELGTGIGLFICKKIIENQNGTIICKSGPSLTTFLIRFKSEVIRKEE